MNKERKNPLKTKKVLFIHKSSSGWGGAQQSVYDLINHFRKEFGKTVFVCNKGLLTKKIKELKVKTYYLPISSICFFPITIIYLIFILLIQKPDIIHSNHRYATFLVQVIRNVFCLPYKILHTARSLFNTKTYIHFLGDKIIAVGEAVRKNLIEEFKISSEKIEVIHNGIELNHKKIKNISMHQLFDMLKFADKTVIGSIGTLIKRKGHCYLFEAVAKLPSSIQKQIILLVIGEGSLHNELQAHVQKLGITKYVKFLGHQDDIMRILNYCSFTVITSNQEGLPRVLVESYLNNKPVIAFDTEFITETIRHQETGITVPLYNISALAHAIKFYVENPKIVDEHGKNGHRFAVEQFSYNKMVKRYRAVYQELLQV